MAEKTTQTEPTTARPAVAETERPARRFNTVAVVEVTLSRAVEEGANHGQTADAAAADLQGGTSEGWVETNRRVKSVRVLAE